MANWRKRRLGTLRQGVADGNIASTALKEKLSLLCRTVAAAAICSAASGLLNRCMSLLGIASSQPWLWLFVAICSLQHTTVGCAASACTVLPLPLLPPLTLPAFLPSVQPLLPLSAAAAGASGAAAEVAIGCSAGNVASMAAAAPLASHTCAVPSSTPRDTITSETVTCQTSLFVLCPALQWTPSTALL